MLYEKDSAKIPKKTAQKLAKFSYYIETLFAQVSQEGNLYRDQQANRSNELMNRLHSKTTSRNMSYSYFCSRCDNLAAINSESILSSVKKLYLSKDVIKISQMSYHKEGVFANKGGYLTEKGCWSEIVDFVLIQNKDNIQKSQPYSNNNSNEKPKLATNSSSIKPSSNTKPTTTNTASSKPKQYWLYVIHNSNPNSSVADQSMQKITWEHVNFFSYYSQFIQRYHFVTNSNNGFKSSIVEKQQSSSLISDSIITYQLLYSYKSEQQYQSYFSSEQSLTKNFIQSHCKVTKPDQNIHLLEKLQGYLLQRSSQVQSSQAKEKDIAFSDQHRRQTKIPIQYFKPYLKLKQQIYQTYIQLYSLSSQDDINKYFYENLICRYLIAKEYHFDEAKKAIIEYLNWEKQLTEKYPSIDCFKQYHQLGAYQCIGEDFMGRPVLLSKSALIDVNKLPDIQKYCDYYIYYLEIYLRTKMRGYVDQMLVIGDLTDLGARNFKLAITKRNLGDSLKYGPERQHGLIVVHASTFAYTAWTFIKPLMPKKTLHKIEISGHNKKDIVEALSSKMDIKVIPEYLGGLNKNVDKQFEEKNEKNTQQNNQQQEIEFSHGKKTNASTVKMQRVKNNDEDDLQKVEMVTTSSATIEAKKSDNVLFSIFQSVTKSLGLSFE